MAKRSDHSGGTALKTRPRAGRIVLWAVLAALLLGAVIGVVSLLGRPSGAETPENTAAPTAAPDTSDTPSETPLPEELREAPLSPEAEIAASAAVRSNGFPMLAWAPDGFSAVSRGRMQYSGGKYLTGIDVSEHQYDIDWEKVAADGIDFAMIRVGYRGSTAGQIYTDEYFEKNIAGATAAGLKVGVYFYSQAINAEEAAEEARFVVERLRGTNVSGPIAYDLEFYTADEARTDDLTGEQATQNALAFCDVIRQAGYEPVVYMNLHWAGSMYGMEALAHLPVWLASYGPVPALDRGVTLWQYSESGVVDGVEGPVDLDLWFTKE